jgi:arylsulfatase A
MKQGGKGGVSLQPVARASAVPGLQTLQGPSPLNRSGTLGNPLHDASHLAHTPPAAEGQPLTSNGRFLIFTPLDPPDATPRSRTPAETFPGPRCFVEAISSKPSMACPPRPTPPRNHSPMLQRPRRLAILVSGFSLLALSLTHSAPAAQRPPNVVILYADDMGFGDLGANNPKSKIPTPHLDRLAAEGTRFTDAHSSSGICTPSRYALLHGRYHWRKFHGIVNAFDEPVLDSERTTLAGLFQKNGYETACIGKWHLGWNWKAIQKPEAKRDPKKGFAPEAFDWSKPIPGGPLDHGFKTYFGDDVPNFPPYAWFENDRVSTPPTVPVTPPGEPLEGHWEARPGPSVKDWDFYAVMPKLTERAVQWIHAQKPEQPFFLYFPFTSPHAPIVPAKEFVGRSQAGAFGDFVVQTDDTVGKVLKALKEKGFEDNTLVIFSADNGAEVYAYQRIEHFDHFSSGPFRGVKRDLWEGGHHVPMLVRWPGHIPAGRTADGLMSQIDIYATLAALLNQPIPDRSAEDSLNQLAFWQGTASSARPSLVHNTKPKEYALRSGDWLLVDAPSGQGSAVPEWYNQRFGYSKNKGPGELYNLREDIAQKTNLLESHPAKVAELRAELKAIKAAGNNAPGAAQ